MIGKYTILALLIVCLLHMQAFADDVPVRVRNDGKIVDIEGNIIAIQNPKDERNSDYEKYYFNVDSKGNPTSDTSNFFIVADPSGIFLRKEIENTEKATNTASYGPNLNPSLTSNGVKNMKVYFDYSQPIYDRLSISSNSVYGN